MYHFYIGVCLSLMVMLLLFPGIAHSGTDLGIALFTEALLPYLLPYLVLTGWLIRLTVSMDLSRIAIYVKIYLISALGGFPTGAYTIAYYAAKTVISTREASFLLAICHFPSPLFVVGFVGTELFAQPEFAWYYLALLHTLSIIAFVAVYWYFRLVPIKQLATTPERFPFTTSMKESVPTVLLVATTIIFFTTIFSVCVHVFSTRIDSPFISLFSATMLEMTTALQLSEKLLLQPFSWLYAVFALSTQGLSIHTQIIVIAKTANIPLLPYFFFRIVIIILIPLTFYVLFL